MLRVCTKGSALCRTWQPHGAAGDPSVHMGSLGLQSLQQEHKGQKENSRPQLAALDEGPRGGSLEGRKELRSWPQLPGHDQDPNGGSAGAQDAPPRIEGTQNRRPGALSLELAGGEAGQCCMRGAWLDCGGQGPRGASRVHQSPTLSTEAIQGRNIHAEKRELAGCSLLELCAATAAHQKPASRP